MTTRNHSLELTMLASFEDLCSIGLFERSQAGLLDFTRALGHQRLGCDASILSAYLESIYLSRKEN